jgi:glycyl-tRNA synthetase beta subunit
MNFLLEIGCEEIPDWMLAGALEYLGGAIGELTKTNAIRTDATARRLVVRAEGLIARKKCARSSSGWICEEAGS